MPTMPDRRPPPLLQAIAADLDDRVDALRRRVWRARPRHIAAYRGYADAAGVELCGRVLADHPRGGPREQDSRWDNLLNAYRRYATDEVAGARLRLEYQGSAALVTSDGEGYYALSMPVPRPAPPGWNKATVALEDGSLGTAQPVLQVAEGPGFGVISDVDDTVLHTGITNWRTAVQLTFLHNARTRKPLDGVAALYSALQAGRGGRGGTPIFYVSSSPWNLYDLLEDFMALNGIPAGPMFLRDLGIDRDKFIKTPGHGHKLDRARALIRRFPLRRWILIGDSGQADAELYAQAAHEFGSAIAAIYIRDVDPDTESPRDRGVDHWIGHVAGTGVPMLRARDSLAMAEHAAGLGLIPAAAIARVAAEVTRDRQRPALAEAASDALVGGAGSSPT